MQGKPGTTEHWPVRPLRRSTQVPERLGERAWRGRYQQNCRPYINALVLALQFQRRMLIIVHVRRPADRDEPDATAPGGNRTPASSIGFVPCSCPTRVVISSRPRPRGWPSGDRHMGDVVQPQGWPFDPSLVGRTTPCRCGTDDADCDELLAYCHHVERTCEVPSARVRTAWSRRLGVRGRLLVRAAVKGAVRTRTRSCAHRPRAVQRLDRCVDRPNDPRQTRARTNMSPKARSVGRRPEDSRP